MIIFPIITLFYVGSTQNQLIGCLPQYENASIALIKDQKYILYCQEYIKGQELLFSIQNDPIENKTSYQVIPSLVWLQTQSLNITSTQILSMSLSSMLGNQYIKTGNMSVFYQVLVSSQIQYMLINYNLQNMEWINMTLPELDNQYCTNAYYLNEQYQLILCFNKANSYYYSYYPVYYLICNFNSTFYKYPQPNVGVDSVQQSLQIDTVGVQTIIYQTFYTETLTTVYRGQITLDSISQLTNFTLVQYSYLQINGISQLWVEQSGNVLLLNSSQLQYLTPNGQRIYTFYNPEILNQNFVTFDAQNIDESNTSNIVIALNGSVCHLSFNNSIGFLSESLRCTSLPSYLEQNSSIYLFNEDIVLVSQSSLHYLFMRNAELSLLGSFRNFSQALCSPGVWWSKQIIPIISGQQLGMIQYQLPSIVINSSIDTTFQLVATAPNQSCKVNFVLNVFAFENSTCPYGNSTSIISSLPQKREFITVDNLVGPALVYYGQGIQTNVTYSSNESSGLLYFAYCGQQGQIKVTQNFDYEVFIDVTQKGVYSYKLNDTIIQISCQLYSGKPIVALQTNSQLVLLSFFGGLESSQIYFYNQTIQDMIIFNEVLLAIINNSIYAYYTLTNELALSTINELNITAPRCFSFNQDVYPNMLFIDNTTNLVVLQFSLNQSYILSTLQYPIQNTSKVQVGPVTKGVFLLCYTASEIAAFLYPEPIVLKYQSQPGLTSQRISLQELNFSSILATTTGVNYFYLYLNSSAGASVLALQADKAPYNVVKNIYKQLSSNYTSISVQVNFNNERLLLSSNNIFATFSQPVTPILELLAPYQFAQTYTITETIVATSPYCLTNNQSTQIISINVINDHAILFYGSFTPEIILYTSNGGGNKIYPNQLFTGNIQQIKVNSGNPACFLPVCSSRISPVSTNNPKQNQLFFAQSIQYQYYQYIYFIQNSLMYSAHAVANCNFFFEQTFQIQQIENGTILTFVGNQNGSQLLVVSSNATIVLIEIINPDLIYNYDEASQLIFMNLPNIQYAFYSNGFLQLLSSNLSWYTFIFQFNDEMVTYSIQTQYTEEIKNPEGNLIRSVVPLNITLPQQFIENSCFSYGILIQGTWLDYIYFAESCFPQNRFQTNNVFVNQAQYFSKYEDIQQYALTTNYSGNLQIYITGQFDMSIELIQLNFKPNGRVIYKKNLRDFSFFGKGQGFSQNNYFVIQTNNGTFLYDIINDITQTIVGSTISYISQLENNYTGYQALPYYFIQCLFVNGSCETVYITYIQPYLYIEPLWEVEISAFNQVSEISVSFYLNSTWNHYGPCSVNTTSFSPIQYVPTSPYYFVPFAQDFVGSNMIFTVDVPYVQLEQTISKPKATPIRGIMGPYQYIQVVQQDYSFRQNMRIAALIWINQQYYIYELFYPDYQKWQFNALINETLPLTNFPQCTSLIYITNQYLVVLCFDNNFYYFQLYTISIRTTVSITVESQGYPTTQLQSIELKSGDLVIAFGTSTTILFYQLIPSANPAFVLYLAYKTAYNNFKLLEPNLLLFSDGLILSIYQLEKANLQFQTQIKTNTSIVSFGAQSSISYGSDFQINIAILFGTFVVNYKVQYIQGNEVITQSQKISMPFNISQSLIQVGNQYVLLSGNYYLVLFPGNQKQSAQSYITYFYQPVKILSFPLFNPLNYEIFLILPNQLIRFTVQEPYLVLDSAQQFTISDFNQANCSITYTLLELYNNSQALVSQYLNQKIRMGEQLAFPIGNYMIGQSSKYFVNGQLWNESFQVEVLGSYQSQEAGAIKFIQITNSLQELRKYIFPFNYSQASEFYLFKQFKSSIFFHAQICSDLFCEVPIEIRLSSELEIQLISIGIIPKTGVGILGIQYSQNQYSYINIYYFENFSQIQTAIPYQLNISEIHFIEYQFFQQYIFFLLTNNQILIYNLENQDNFSQVIIPNPLQLELIKIQTNYYYLNTLVVLTNQSIQILGVISFGSTINFQLITEISYDFLYSNFSGKFSTQIALVESGIFLIGYNKGQVLLYFCPKTLYIYPSFQLSRAPSYLVGPNNNIPLYIFNSPQILYICIPQHVSYVMAFQYMSKGNYIKMAQSVVTANQIPQYSIATVGDMDLVVFSFQSSAYHNIEFYKFQHQLTTYLYFNYLENQKQQEIVFFSVDGSGAITLNVTIDIPQLFLTPVTLENSPQVFNLSQKIQFSPFNFFNGMISSYSVEIINYQGFNLPSLTSYVQPITISNHSSNETFVVSATGNSAFNYLLICEESSPLYFTTTQECTTLQVFNYFNNQTIAIINSQQVNYCSFLFLYFISYFQQLPVAVCTVNNSYAVAFTYNNTLQVMIEFTKQQPYYYWRASYLNSGDIFQISYCTYLFVKGDYIYSYLVFSYNVIQYRLGFDTSSQQFYTNSSLSFYAKLVFDDSSFNDYNALECLQTSIVYVADEQGNYLNCILVYNSNLQSLTFVCNFVNQATNHSIPYNFVTELNPIYFSERVIEIQYFEGGSNLNQTSAEISILILTSVQVYGYKLSLQNMSSQGNTHYHFEQMMVYATFFNYPPQFLLCSQNLIAVTYSKSNQTILGLYPPIGYNESVNYTGFYAYVVIDGLYSQAAITPNNTLILSNNTKQIYIYLSPYITLLFNLSNDVNESPIMIELLLIANGVESQTENQFLVTLQSSYQIPPYQKGFSNLKLGLALFCFFIISLSLGFLCYKSTKRNFASNLDKTKSQNMIELG